ncbi:MAG: VCBS repeat-containing protein [Caldilineaceae bacterium]
MIGFPINPAFNAPTPALCNSATYHSRIWLRPSRGLLILLVVIASGVAFAPHPVKAEEPTFTARRQFGTGNDDTGSVAVGDVNGDGHLDLVSGNGWYSRGQQNMVYLNDGYGNFPQTLGRPFGTGTDFTAQIALGDMNGDGYLDLVTGNQYEQSRVYLNDGQGNFPQALGHPFGLAGGEIGRIAVGDLNGDGHLDLISGSRNGAHTVYLNDGLGNFPQRQRRPFGKGDIDKDMALGDLDGDGDLDLVTANWNQAAIYLNDGTGNLVFKRLVATDIGANCVVLADMNGDGALDLITGARRNAIYLNDGKGNFPSEKRYLLQAEVKLMLSLAVGDMDSDGDLDLFAGTEGQNILYLNDGDGHIDREQALGGSSEGSHSVAMGDLDDDGDLDLVAGRDGQDAIFLNDGQGNFRQAQENALPLNNHALAPLPVSGLTGDGAPGAVWPKAVGDVDNDGDLDLILGAGSYVDPQADTNLQPNRIYLNDGQDHFPLAMARPFGAPGNPADVVAIGDLDNDGDLDLVAGNRGYYDPQEGVYKRLNRIYLNDGQGNFPLEAGHPFGTGQHTITALALGDMNGDGALDLVMGTIGESNRVYLNDGQGNFPSEAGRSFGTGSDRTQALAIGDMDSDGDLDLVVGNDSPFAGEGFQPESMVYLNDGDGNFLAATARRFGDYFVDRVALADLDGDGDLDILTDQANYLNEWRHTAGLANQAPQIRITNLNGYANLGATTPSVILDSAVISIPYTLSDRESDNVGEVAAFYSLNGGGQWLPAIAAPGTLTRHLATAPDGVAYIFEWDTFASGFFGQSDNVVVRLVAYSQPLSTTTPITDTYRYTNTTAGPYQYPSVSTTTSPFRVRGTQVRVLDDEGNPVANAQVYRLPRGTVSAAELMPTATQPLTTPLNGYLGGRGALAIGDQLLALVPISHNLNYTLYATSGIPNENGLTMSTVTQAGVQTLSVSPAHPLLLFDLDISLEWDASNDGLFYQQLTTAFERASAILYDVSDGQIALGEVRIHPNREQWLSADVVIYANNNLRPRATMGGLVASAQDETQGLHGVLPNAYTPGQVRMGPIWDPFAQNFAELTQDWQRALAHELAHYLLYLPDNYLGVDKGILRITNCQGSLMTDAYNPDYSEFLTPTEWTQPPGNPCLRTVAATLLTGRSDWATITHFYPGLHIPQNKLQGPALLPLAVTKVRVIPAATGQLQPVTARNYDLRNEAGNVTLLRQAQSYVLQGKGTATTTDDSLLYLGSTGVGSDRILVRGAEAGDKVCVLDTVSEPARAGCELVTAQSTSIQVHSVAGWRPDIQISPVTSTTFQITVTQVGDVGQLFVQFLPAYAPNPASAAVRSMTERLTPVASTPDYTATITLAYPTFEGFVRVYSEQDPDHAQSITQFFLSGDWGPPGGWRGGNGVNRAWGANSRSLEAPVASGDGKVTILNLSDLLADTGDTTLQTVTDLPNLPNWLAAVGSGYRIRSSKDLTRTLMFQYNQRDVPPGYEQTLTLYYLPSGGSEWQRLVTGPLATGVDPDDNLATVIMPHTNRGDGIYALLATVQLQPLFPGWNPLTFPVGAAQSVTRALASVEGTYTTVYAYQRGASLPWPLFDRTVDPTFAPLVNTLQTLQFGHNYLIYATQVVTPYIGVVGDGQEASVAAVLALDSQGIGGAIATVSDELIAPPATFYGFVTGRDGNVLREGMTIQAQIGGVVCGDSQLQSWQGQLAYVIQVKADSGDGCGKIGRTIRFAIEGQPASFTATWDNRQTTLLLPEGK